MLLCSYENRTKETLDPKKLESGELKLSDLLTEEDFDMAHLASTSLTLPTHPLPCLFFNPFRNF